MFSCVGDSLRWTAGAVEVVVTIEYDPDPDTSYLEQEEFAEQLAEYQAGLLTYSGIVARVVVDVDGRDMEIGHASCWGYESGSTSYYLEEEARSLALEAISVAGTFAPTLARLLAEHESELATLSSLVAVV